MSRTARIGRRGRVLELVDQVYEIEDDDRSVATFFDRLRLVLPFSSAVLLPVDCGRLELEAGFGCDFPADLTRPYLDRYAALDPFLQRGPQTPGLNRGVRLADLVGEEELARSEFAEYSGRVPFRHALCAVVGHRRSPVAAFAVYRRADQEAFSLDEAAVLETIAPHLGRALALRRASTPVLPGDPPGVLAFDARGRLRFMNASAQRFCDEANAPRVRAALAPEGPGSLRLGERRYRVARIAWSPASLLTGLALDDDLPSSPTGDRPGGRRLPVVCVDWAVVRDAAARLVIVTLAPFQRREDLRTRLERYGLSRRELAITAHCILDGLANGQLASSLCISEETVKSHLREVYRKTGVSGRAQLIVKVLGLENELALRHRSPRG